MVRRNTSFETDIAVHHTLLLVFSTHVALHNRAACENVVSILVRPDFFRSLYKRPIHGKTDARNRKAPRIPRGAFALTLAFIQVGIPVVGINSIKPGKNKAFILSSSFCLGSAGLRWGRMTGRWEDDPPGGPVMLRYLLSGKQGKTHRLSAHPLNSLDLHEITGSGRGAEALLSAPIRYSNCRQQTHVLRSNPCAGLRPAQGHECCCSHVHALEEEEFRFFLSDGARFGQNGLLSRP